VSTEKELPLETATFEDLLGAANDTKYDHVNAYGKRVRIGSLCSADMIEWLESNDDKVKSKFSGIRMIVKSFVDDKGARLPGVEDPAKFEEYVKLFSQKDAISNGRVVKAVLELNGIRTPKQVADALKNDSGETSTDASPTDSASK
jgi:hypothetical protein